MRPDGVQIIPRFHLFVRREPEETWGWDHHLGAHSSKEHLLSETRKLPDGAMWQVVDIVTFQIVARSEELGIAKH